LSYEIEQPVRSHSGHITDLRKYISDVRFGGQAVAPEAGAVKSLEANSRGPVVLVHTQEFHFLKTNDPLAAA
jgi:hypothetical protein